MTSRKRTRTSEPVNVEVVTDFQGNELSEYEKSRMDQIHKNEQFLASLGLDSVKQSIEMLKPQKKPATKKGVMGTGPKPSAVPVRRSGRVTTEKLKAEIDELVASNKIEE